MLSIETAVAIDNVIMDTRQTIMLCCHYTFDQHTQWRLTSVSESREKGYRGEIVNLLSIGV